MKSNRTYHSLHYEKFADGTVICIEDEIPFQVPESWEWCRLCNIAQVKGGKRLPKGETFATAETNHGYIRVVDMKNHTINQSDLKYISDSVFDKIKNYTISSDDLYITIAGSIGIVGEVPPFHNGMNLTENAAKITEIKINNSFLCMLLQSSFVQKQFRFNTFQVAMPKLALERLLTTLIPIPPINEQMHILDVEKSAFGIIDSISQNQTELTEIITSVKAHILDLAIRGKLVPHDPTDEPASVLLERIRAEKEELIKQGKIKRDKGESVIFKGEDNSYYHRVEKGELVQIKKLSFPSGWTVCSITDIAYSVGNKNNQVQNKEISENGLYPVISQSKDFIDGYCDLKNKVISDLPLILFGDHTRNVKYINFPFVIGADGTKLFKIILANDKYIYYWMIYAAGNIIDKGYARHLGALKQECLYLPPLKEQNRIVKAIEDAFTTVDSIAENL